MFVTPFAIWMSPIDVQRAATLNSADLLGMKGGLVVRNDAPARK
jgi:hypothetical protein